MRLQVGNQIIDLNLGSGNSFKPIILVAFLVLLVFCGMNSYYTVQQDEQAVVTRFGKWIDTSEPGLHFKIPFVDMNQNVKVQQQQNMQFGISSENSSRNKYRNSWDKVEQEKSMVTGDLNAVQVQWVIQYRITDPKAFLFNVRNPDETLRDASESVMRQVVGDRTVDEAITIGRTGIEEACKVKLIEMADQYELGLTINQVQLVNVEPPAQNVKDSFNEVNRAQQMKEEKINNARGEYNKEVPKARGDAERMISEANGYAIKRINYAEGDAAKFTALFNEYQKSPDVTRQRIYLETMEKVMPKLGKKVIIDEGANQVLPLLQLDSLGK